jgi:hypothetical protein
MTGRETRNKLADYWANHDRYVQSVISVCLQKEKNMAKSDG